MRKSTISLFQLYVFTVISVSSVLSPFLSESLLAFLNSWGCCRDRQNQVFSVKLQLILQILRRKQNHWLYLCPLSLQILVQFYMLVLSSILISCVCTHSITLISSMLSQKLSLSEFALLFFQVLFCNYLQ